MISPWVIETETVDIVADFIEGQLFDTAPGSEISASFYFVSRAKVDDAQERHEALQPFVDAAVDGITIRARRNARSKPYYREDLVGYDIDSLLVALVPRYLSPYGENGYGDLYGSPIRDRGAVWAVLRSGSDNSIAVERDVYAWDLDLTVLKRYDESDDREDIVTEFRDELI